MWKLLVILAVVKLYARIDIYIINTFGFQIVLQFYLKINLRNKKLLASLDPLYSDLSFDSTTHDHLLDRQYHSVNLLMATLKFYLERRNYRAYIFVFAISAPLYIYIFFYQGFLSQTLVIHRTAAEGRGSSFRGYFLDIQATIECGFTLKRVRDITRTYSHSDICLQHCLSDNYQVVLISTLVFIRLLLNEIYHLID